MYNDGPLPFPFPEFYRGDGDGTQNTLVIRPDFPPLEAVDWKALEAIGAHGNSTPSSYAQEDVVFAITRGQIEHNQFWELFQTGVAKKNILALWDFWFPNPFGNGTTPLPKELLRLLPAGYADDPRVSPPPEASQRLVLGT